MAIDLDPMIIDVLSSASYSMNVRWISHRILDRLSERVISKAGLTILVSRRCRALADEGTLIVTDHSPASGNFYRLAEVTE